MHIKSKAATLWRLAFSLTLLVLVVACEDPSSVGGEYVEKNKVVVDTILVDNLIGSTADPYLGRLSSTPVGSFSDPLYGDISSFSFLKVPIEAFVADTVVLSDTTTIQLNLRLQDAVFGDTTTTTSFRIVRVTEQWRGSTFRQSSSLVYNDTETIASFSDTDVDSTGLLTVELGGSWKQDYINYFNSDADNRLELYEQNEYGLAILAESGAGKINYFNLAATDLVIQEPLNITLDVYDWGYDLDETRGTTPADRVILSNKYDQFFTLNLQQYADDLPSQNIIKAELIFTQDTTAINSSLSDSEVRTSVSQMGMIIGATDDVAYELGFTGNDLTGFLLEGDFVFDVTPAFNNYYFHTTDISELYIYLLTNQGYLSYTQLFSESADPDVAPKLVIYSLEEE